jgi:hypothetical protein
MKGPQILLAFAMALGMAKTSWPARADLNVSNSEKDEYEFVKDTDKWVSMIMGDRHPIGKLDDAGNFIADKRYFDIRKGQPLSQIPPSRTINSPEQKDVYEFRSGRLIPGDIDDKGNFIPTAGGSILDFKDYHYSPKAPKIYNLPGKFVLKKKKDDKK